MPAYPPNAKRLQYPTWPAAKKTLLRRLDEAGDNVGFGIATKRSVSSAAVGVLIAWGVYVALKVGWAALMG